MQKKYTIILIIVSMLSFSNCASVKSDFQIDYYKFKGRMVKAPHYIIKIKGDSVYYNGINNMPVLGEHNFKMSNANFITIKNEFEKSSFKNFNKLYQGKIRDIPITSITYKNYEVRYQEKEAPEKLIKLSKIIQDLIPAK